MKAPWILFAILLALCLVVGLAMTVAPGLGGSGVQHPEILSMERSGPAPTAPQGLWIGWLLGVLQVAFFVACLAFGMRKRDRPDRRAWYGRG